MTLAFLPPKLCEKSAVPPCESVAEVLQSKALDRIAKRRHSVLFTDGAKAWPSSLERLGMDHVTSQQVRHSHKEFVNTGQQHSSLAGTMSVDSRWRQLKEWICASTNNKHGKQVNKQLETLVFAWLWRHNRDVSEPLADDLGRLCREECTGHVQ